MKDAIRIMLGSVALGALSVGTARAEVLVDNVHADIGIGGEFDGDTWEWEPHIHDETNDLEYDDLADTFFVVNALTATSSSDAPLNVPLYADLFSSSSAIYHLDQNEQAGELFLGIGAEELDPAHWDGALTMTTTGVSGPGDFVMFNYPYSIVTDTRDGLDGSDSFLRLAGSHAHFNWIFTEPGDYAVTFLIEGQFSNDSGVPAELQGTITSVEATWNFRVVPAPGTCAVAALGLMGLTRRRR